MADVRKASCEVAAMSKPASRPQALQKRLISHANVKTAETYFVFLKNSMGETENNFGKGRTNLGIVVHFPGWQNNLRAGKTFLGARDSFFGGGTAVLGETAKRFPAAGQFVSSDSFMGQIQTEGGENNGAKYQSQNNNGGELLRPVATIGIRFKE